MKYELAISSWGVGDGSDNANTNVEVAAAEKVLESGFTTMGKAVSECEAKFAEHFGAKYAVMVNSGSSANLLAVAAMFFRKEGTALKRGDEVIVPAVSWATTYSPLQQYGLHLKFVDIDLDTLNYDLEALGKAVSDNTKAIICVNLLGNPNDFNKIKSIIGNRDITLLEDNCESLGAGYKSADGKTKFTGTFGLMGTFSSFFSHHISTMEGGMILTDDEEIYHILLSIRSHGWTRHLPKENKVTGTKSADPFEEQFRFVLPGYNVRPLEIMGAIGLEQLKKANKFIDWRQKNAKYFQQKFKDNHYFYNQKEIGKSSWFGFSFILKDSCKFTRKDLLKYLAEKQIETRPIVAGNFTKNEVLKYFDYEVFGEMKNAEYLDKNGFFVGNHQFDIKDKIDYLYDSIMEFCRK